MKYLTILFVGSLFMLQSCDKSNQVITGENENLFETDVLNPIVDPSIADNGYRLATQEEIDKMIDEGVYIGFSDAMNCEWSDGQYGTVNCDSGATGCEVVLTLTEKCLACDYDGTLGSPGACRPI